MSKQWRLSYLAGFALAAALAGCATAPTTDPGVTFLVVRHAEKASDGRDPGLTSDGEARARALAARLDGKPVRAAYATAYRRTQMTATPTARAHGLTVSTYDADLPPDAFAAQLRSAHPQGEVLVVGHSNTAPQIAAALCGCTVAPMGDGEFDRLMTVRIDATGHAELGVQRY
jgi:broad specificity phosphatase PhoE